MEKFKKIWFILFMVLLSIPMLQNYTGWFKEKPLNGAYIPSIKPKLTLKSLWNYRYQDSAIAYIEENIGFHNTLVRLNNQMIFSIFRESPISGPVLGKNGMLYEESYIAGYVGATFLGNEEVEKISFRLKTAQEILASKGVTLIVVHTPGKASFYPEDIPDKYHVENKARTNYDAYVEYLTRDEVNFIDLNKHICEMKDTASQTLYCSLSAHWTLYAAVVSLDSIINYMETFTDQELRDFRIAGFEKSDTLRNQDDDLFKTMNLMILPDHNEVQYPILEYTTDQTKHRPKVLTIGDSYWWTLYAYKVEIPQKLFADGGFWFYNKTIYPKREPIQNLESINYYDEVNSQEFVLLHTTEATNHLFPYEFCDKYLIGYEKEFAQKITPDEYTAIDSMYMVCRNQSINSIIAEINSNANWKNNIIKQAKEQNTDLETMIYRNAEYTYKLKAGVIQ